MGAETRSARPTRDALPAALVHGAAVLLVVRSWRVDRVPAWLVAPHLAWTLFATLLTAAIAVLN